MLRLLSISLLLSWQSASWAAEPTADVLAKGQYIFRASGGCSCHIAPDQDDGTLSGGRALATPFGTFYSTNITPDKKAGIGTWTVDDFVKSMEHGVRPSGERLYPTFPFPSFTKMKRDDLVALATYVLSLKPSAKANIAPDVPFPFSLRSSVMGWTLLFFDDAKWQPDPSKSEAWNRGSYLAEAVGHCGECHTPRNVFGSMQRDRYFAGTAQGPEGDPIPNITSHADGIGDWSEVDLAYYLKTGMTPDGDFASGVMAEIIEHGYQHLTDEDLSALATYLKAVPPLADE